jgi:chlorite dismutase
MMNNLPEPTTNKTLTAFYGGQTGNWKVLSMKTITGQAMEPVTRINNINLSESSEQINSVWTLKGISSNLRYTTRDEKTSLDKTPSVLGKPEFKYAALIPIQKSPEWWLLTQDERRKIFEDKSKHIDFSLSYLKSISRKLYHSKDMGEPFDFLTWFEFAPEHVNQFDDLVHYLRNTEEWKYVTRETDIRLIRSDSDK